MMHEQDAYDLVLPLWDLDTVAGAMQQWHMCLDATVLVGGRKLREQDAGVLEDSKDSHWRQPLTSDSQAFVPEVTILHHPIGRATDIRTIQEWVITGLSKSAPNILSCSQISWPHTIREVFQAVLLGCRVYTLRSFICHHVGEPTHADGQPTLVYQMGQLATNRQLAYGRLTQRARTVGKKDSFIVELV